ncbi:MAG TPA: lysoplasmalogenase [Quisquiliibacterium sp.]|nr:lysoplasmalogenase [Quisquiliibacterium sp.]
MSAAPAPVDRRWVAAIATCAALAILAKLLAADWMYWAFKPLATILIAGLALRRGGGIYARTVFVGLLLSLAGDVLLIPPGLFVGGLAAFLAAHVAYLFAFTREVRFAARTAPFVAVAAIAFAILAVLWPRLPAGLGIPVLAYVAMLGAMTAQAFARHAALRTPASRSAAIGGALFLASDALLAIDRFHTALPMAALLVLGTYYPAQVLIALSIERSPAAGTPPGGGRARETR